MESLSQSERLLLALCRKGPPQASSVSGDSGPVPPGVFEGLMDLAVYHGVQGLVLTRLLVGAADSGPFPQRTEEIRSAAALVGRQAILWDFEQDRVLRELSREGFDPIVLKGAALRRWVYASPVERILGDLDILVDREEVGPVLAVLAGLGYESEYSEEARAGFRNHLYHDRVRHKNGFEVEVHWDLTRPGSPLRLNTSAFKDRSQILRPPTSPPLRAPSAEDMILHTVSQSEQDGVRKLRRIVDLDRVIGSCEPDWTYIRHEAGSAGLSVPLAVTCRLTQMLLGTAVPRQIASGLDVAPAARVAIAIMTPPPRLLRRPGKVVVADHALFRLWCLPDWSTAKDRIRTIAKGVQDPLGWIWKEEPGPAQAKGDRRTGVLRLLKLAVYQAALLGRGLLLALSPTQRKALRFWDSAG